MWAKIGEDMAALSEVRGDEESGTKEAMGWKGQLPSVLQEKQQSSGDSGGAANGQQVDSSEGDSEQAEGGVHSTNGKKKQNPVSNKAAAMAEKRNSFKRNSSLAKNVAKLVEQYELQETAQREWEEQQSLEQNEVRRNSSLCFASYVISTYGPSLLSSLYAPSLFSVPACRQINFSTCLKSPGNGLA